MTTTILLFGRLAELTGQANISLENITDTDTLQKRLTEEYPQLANLKYLVAANKQVVTGNEPINENTIIALLPPFSGG